MTPNLLFASHVPPPPPPSSSHYSPPTSSPSPHGLSLITAAALPFQQHTRPRQCTFCGAATPSSGPLEARADVQTGVNVSVAQRVAVHILTWTAALIRSILTLGPPSHSELHGAMARAALKVGRRPGNIRHKAEEADTVLHIQ